MESVASSPAGRRSTETTMHPPPESVAAARVAANEAAGKLGLTGIQTFEIWRSLRCMCDYIECARIDIGIRVHRSRQR